MIALVEGARRQKTPNEIALEVLLCGMTIIFLVVCVSLVPFGLYSGVRFSTTAIAALLVCLIPTTIGALLSAIGIAGMDRLVRKNVIPTSGRAVEAAGDVDIMLLDKTGTITFGNRQAVALVPAPGGHREVPRGGRAAGVSSGRDAGGAQHRAARQATVRSSSRPGAGRRSPGGCQLHCLLGPDPHERRRPAGARVRKGAADAIRAWCVAEGNPVPLRWRRAVETIARSGGTPLLVARDGRAIGVVHLKDVVKGGIKERFARFRAMGLQDSDDHRRQPADGSRHRGRGRRRRLPGRGDPRDEARADPRRSRPRGSWSP